MEMMGIHFEIMSSNAVEVVTGTEPEEIVQALARQKACEIATRVEENKELDTIILGADTMVFHHDIAMGKPKDESDAKQMIQSLANDSHMVFTGVSVIIKKRSGEEKILSFAVGTKVVVRPMTEEQISDYVATKEPMDKAGGYGIQGKFGIYIKEIIGDYYNVVGFPIAKIYEVLLTEGINLLKI